MIGVNPKPHEPHDAYLVRCLQTAKRTRTTVAASCVGELVQVSPALARIEQSI
jgi:hypothetical protein